jgi:hypothetical protein
VRDERSHGRRGAHTRSMPQIIEIKIANIAMPITTATASMRPISTGARYARVSKRGRRITIS